MVKCVAHVYLYLYDFNRSQSFISIQVKRKSDFIYSFRIDAQSWTLSMDIKRQRRKIRRRKNGVKLTAQITRFDFIYFIILCSMNTIDWSKVRFCCQLESVLFPFRFVLGRRKKNSKQIWSFTIESHSLDSWKFFSCLVPLELHCNIVPRT